MISIKKPHELELLRECGKRNASILREVAKFVAPGVSTEELDQRAFKLTTDQGDTPSFLGYTPHGVTVPYPKSLCVSINDEVVHGIPSPDRILKEGDIVTLDMGLSHEGMLTDHAVTVTAGKVTPEEKKLVKATREALDAGIQAAVGGNTIGDIGNAIQKVAEKYGFAIAEELAGHGVGYKVHEDPYVPNEGEPGEGDKLVPGMVLALEPMLTMGSSKVVFDDDQYTVRTKDGTKSAHFEHTIIITEGKAEVITK